MKLMKKMSLSVLVGAMVMGTQSALAEGDRVVPEAIERSKVMLAVGAATKVLGQMAAGEAEFDAAAATAAKAALVESPSTIVAAFATEGAADPASEALPTIWTNPDSFAAQLADFELAAQAIDVTSLNGIRAGMGALGGSCKACHTDHRR